MQKRPFLRCSCSGEGGRGLIKIISILPHGLHNQQQRSPMYLHLYNEHITEIKPLTFLSPQQFCQGFVFSLGNSGRGLLNPGPSNAGLNGCSRPLSVPGALTKLPAAAPQGPSRAGRAHADRRRPPGSACPPRPRGCPGPGRSHGGGAGPGAGRGPGLSRELGPGRAGPGRRGALRRRAGGRCAGPWRCS